jgi:hypothetical protein
MKWIPFVFLVKLSLHLIFFVFSHYNSSLGPPQQRLRVLDVLLQGLLSPYPPAAGANNSTRHGGMLSGCYRNVIGMLSDVIGFEYLMGVSDECLWDLIRRLSYPVRIMGSYPVRIMERMRVSDE